MTNLSQWFLLSEQTPWEVGVYELTGNPSWHYCYAYWDGQSFSYAWASEIVGSRQLAYESRNQKNQVHWFSRMKKWRGLSTDPEVKKNPVNKRKTMYMVMKAISNSPVASFSNVNAARDYAGRVNFPVRIRRIRFRTPE